MTDRDTLRVLFWNAWLLRPTLWSGGPALPGGDRLFAPHVRERARLVGAALAGRFDAVALAETFEPGEQQAVLAGWAGRPEVTASTGPRRRPASFAGSGLFTVTDRRPVRRTVRHTYAAHGSRLRDADDWAVKGALLVELDLGEARPGLDLVSTHLFAGADLFPLPGADDGHRHHAVRMTQVDELVAFVADVHRDENALLVVGDFNVAAHDRRLPDDPSARYRDLAGRLGEVGLADLWVQLGVGVGTTSTGALEPLLTPDPDEPDAVADGADDDGPDAPDPIGDRIDQLWFRPPVDGGVTPGRPRRWAFPREVAGARRRLSDHLAVSVDLTWSAG